LSLLNELNSKDCSRNKPEKRKDQVEDKKIPKPQKFQRKRQLVPKIAFAFCSYDSIKTSTITQISAKKLFPNKLEKAFSRLKH